MNVFNKVTINRILRNRFFSKNRKVQTKDILFTNKSIEVGKNENINNDQAIKLLNDSYLVDKEFYWEKYTDVKRRGVDPVIHFVRYGHKENRMPNKYFDTAFYRSIYNIKEEINPLLEYYLNANNYSNITSEIFDGRIYYYLHPDVMKAKINPLTHYLKYGKKENRNISLQKKLESNSFFNGDNYNISRKINKVKLTIIVPIYNAIEEVINCLDSVILNTTLGENVFVLAINDCSPDPRVVAKLDKYSTIQGFTVIHNESNLGYTGNINKGIELANDHDVILLNSDTVVTPNWFRNLIIAAYSNDDIATVTAVSNNAGAFSVPQAGRNEVIAEIGVKGTARLVNKLVSNTLIDVPTGNGFCLYIKREAINEIGNFDIRHYPRGYGEENDFCMRLVEKGWTNVVDPKTYIYHKRSASFKESKQALIEAGVAQVKKTYPNYEGAIKAIGQSKLMTSARELIEQELKKVKASDTILKPKLMFVISTRTGGTPQTNLDLMRGLADIYDCYALACNSKVVEILRAGKEGYEQVEKFELNQKVIFATHRSHEYEIVVKSLLIKYNIDLLHIRHIAWHSLKLPKIAKELYIPVVKSFHDFYTICPSVNLISEQGQLSLSGVCKNAPNLLWSDETVKPINEDLLRLWQNKMKYSLQYCDHYITTCQSAKDIIVKSLGKLNKNGQEFTVIPHGRDFKSFLEPNNVTYPVKKLKVLLPGNISLSKGKDLIKEIISLDVDKKIEFHVLGNCAGDLKPLVVYHGTYKREDFQKYVLNIAPDISAIFSIWPETYCHTLTESWATGIPVMGLSYGAVKQRITQHGGGWLVENDAKACFQALVSLLDNQKEIKNRKQEIIVWQKGYGLSNSVDKMTGKYLSIYQNLLSKQDNAKLPEKRKLGFVLKGIYPDVPPTAYIRLVDWKEEFEYKTGLIVEFITWQNLVTADIQEYQEVIIQRNAIPEGAVNWCLNALKKFKINYTYEIDDNLLNIPDGVDPQGIYARYKPHFENLLCNASSVHVTNSALALLYKKYNENIIIRPNKIFPRRWNMIFSAEEKIDLALPKNVTKILYFGSMTHQEELDFFLEVLAKLNESEVKYHLTIIGCGNIAEKNKRYTARLIPPNSRYDKFTSWLTKIAHNFDIGVAPLVNEDYAKTKSYLKCLEYQALGLPVLCSDVLPYSELKNNRSLTSVKWIKNDIESWSKALDGCRCQVKMT